MKRYTAAIILFSLIMFAFSCGKEKSETLPRDAYSISPEGATLKKSPDESADKIGTVPFGWKITLSEKGAASTSGAWYKISWNGTEGWVNGTSVTEMNGFAGILKKRFTDDQSNVKSEYRNSFSFDKPDGLKKYVYTGGEMEPASMTLLPGGGMILNSKIFSENYMNYYFLYEFMNGGQLVKITFADTRLNFADYADIENSSSSVFKIDRNGGSIIYHVKNNSFFFMNWGFVAQNNF